MESGVWLRGRKGGKGRGDDYCRPNLRRPVRVVPVIAVGCVLFGGNVYDEAPDREEDLFEVNGENQHQ